MEETVYVDVCAKPTSTARVGKIKEIVAEFMESCTDCLEVLEAEGSFTFTEFPKHPYLGENILQITVNDDGKETRAGQVSNGDLIRSKVFYFISVYQCHQDGAGQEELDDQTDVSAATHWLLPAQDFEGIWENLIFDSDIKQSLLNYALSTMAFSAANIDSNIISWNRVILLHGPPGTGKTSLCKALAQKLCVRMSHRYRYGQLVEINSHGLFSKWFSESGKLVVKMFQRVQEMVDDPETLVCILMDEVESLTAVRRASGNEPSDAIRVVNALLTQIDQLKRYPNVLVLTTSNVTGAIDLAFVDRADIKQYIGLPSPAAIYRIYTTCLNELMNKNIIQPAQSIPARWTKTASQNSSAQYLYSISQKSQGLSGRTLRKIPFLAHARFVRAGALTLHGYLQAMEAAVREQFAQRADLSHQTGDGVSS